MMMLQVDSPNDAGARHVSGARNPFDEREIIMAKRRGELVGALYVISMEIKQSSAERRILRRDQTQPTTKDQLESKTLIR